MKIRRRSVPKLVMTSSDWISPAWSSVASFQGGCVLSIVCLSIVIAWRVYKRSQNYELPARDITKGHPWYPIDAFSNTAFCSICDSLIIDGFYCDSCGVCTDNSCLKKADKDLPCKALSYSGSSMDHHWVKGNLPSIHPCEVCEADCGSEASINDFRCCWCQRTVHAKCKKSVQLMCDFGPYKSFIVPPFCVTLKKVGIKGRRHLVVNEVKPPAYRPWSPLIVIGNRKSGNNDGELVLRSFRAYLNPAQVIDLYDIKPERGLQWCKLITDQVCRILVAGGDGTVGWVLNAIDRLNIEPQPQVCILPMGTGNDLSRDLGWGYCYSGDLDVKKTLDQISTATLERLDRWNVKISPLRNLPLRLPKREYFMNNYASVGVDALVALNFHQTRESKFYIYGSRLINRFLYMIYGAKDILDRGCEHLQKKIEVYLDGERLKLPELEAVVILNISSWGGGVQPWSMGPPDPRFLPQKFDDGLLEVFGIYSSFHIAQLQVGLSEPVKLGQARNVMIRLLDKIPIQIDGEPWNQHPAEINIVHHQKAFMLSNAQ